MRTATKEAYQLIHDGAVALADVEANGIRIDTAYLDSQIDRQAEQIKQLEASLRADKIWTQWKRTYGSKSKLGSNEQLAHLVFTVMGYECKDRTDTGKVKADEHAFNRVDLPFVRNWQKLEKIKKVRSTYLLGLKRHVTAAGFLHPVFNLHTVKTFRSSSDSPNFQNFPIRDEEQGKIIRRAFIPRDNHVIVEIDYSGIEVCIAACYHKDPTMLTYIKDKTKDMHRDMAAQCFMTTADQVTKQMRYCGKNMFVFPEFYGSFWRDCAENLWDALTSHNLVMANGTRVIDHLAKKGITELGSSVSHYRDDRGSVVQSGKVDRQGGGDGRIEARDGYYKHISDVETDFWGKRFPIYARWKKKWYDRYKASGGYHTLTGFYIQGDFARNDVINHPVQGSAFHCLLWSLIRINRRLQSERWRSKVVGQIHDSIVADVHVDELDDYLGLCRQIMTRDLLKEWKWIIVPLEVEAEATPVGGTWHDKKGIAIP